MIRWTTLLVLVGTAIAVPLLPPGRIVQQAEGPLRSFAAALGWRGPTDMSAERAYRQAERERFAARRAYVEEVTVQFSWNLADAVNEVAAAAQRAGAPILFETLELSSEDLEAVSDAREGSDCALRDLPLGRPVRADLVTAPCQYEGAPSVRYRFELAGVTPFVAMVSSPSVRPHIRLGGPSLGRAVFGVARGSTASITALVLEAGAYELEVFAEGGAVPDEVTLRAEVPDGALLAPGSSLPPADDMATYYRLDLEEGREYAVRLAPGMALLNGSGLQDGPGVLVVSGNEPQVVVARSPGGAGPVVELSEALDRSGAVLDFEGAVSWTPGATGVQTFAFDVMEPRAVEVGVRSGDGAVPARSWVVGPSGVMPVSREHPLSPGRYGLVVALDDPGPAASGETFVIELRCAAGVVVARLDAPARWTGPRECDPERGAATAWQLDLETPTVVAAEWEEGGRVGVVRDDSEGWWGRLGTGMQLEAGRYYLLAEGTAARSIRVLGLGSPEERLRGIVLAAVDSAGSTEGAAALTGFVFSPVRPEGFGRTGGVPVVTGVVDGTPFCAVVRFGTPMTWRSWDTPELGICSFYARFGAPGASVEAWLPTGGAAFGASARPADAEALRWAWESGDRGPLGMMAVMPYGPVDVDTEACLEGRTQRCAALWDVDPHPVSARSPVRGLVDFEGDAPFYGRESFVLTTLLGEFGDDAFARFWSSDLSLEDAFASAFGVPRGEWTRDYAIAMLGPRAGRGGTWVDGLFVLAFVMLLGAAAARTSARRSVS